MSQEAVLLAFTFPSQIWKSKELCDDGRVPWDVEAVNDVPDDLQWKPSRSFVTAVRPGLYQVAVAFFSPTPPRVTLCVDDSPVVSASPRYGVVADASLVFSSHEFTPVMCMWDLRLVVSQGIRESVDNPQVSSAVATWPPFLLPLRPSYLALTHSLTHALTHSRTHSRLPCLHSCRHPVGCVGGVTIIEFLALPARARVSVCYHGETMGQGMLWVQKL